MLSHPDVSILIVSYNTREMTLAAIQSVYDETHQNSFEIIVADNISADGSADAIAARFPDVTLIRTGKNLGFGLANNLAAQTATGEFILLLNPDTVILEGAIDRLLDFARANPAAQMWGGRTVFADGSLNSKSCWRFMSLWSLLSDATGLARVFSSSALFNREAYGGWARDTEREVDMITGCFLLLRRKFWDTLGGFDPRFFIYAEEADLCFRAIEAGARPRVTHHATIIHYGGASESQRAGKIIRLFTGKATFLRKHWSKPAASVGVSLLKLHTLVRWFSYATVARLKGSAHHRDNGQVWRTVWQERRIWEKGYPPVTDCNQTS